MIEFIVVMLFFGIDIALVVAALLWLSDRRSRADITDMRYARRRRYR
jgi:hypothetical protein